MCDPSPQDGAHVAPKPIPAEGNELDTNDNLDDSCTLWLFLCINCDVGNSHTSRLHCGCFCVLIVTWTILSRTFFVVSMNCDVGDSCTLLLLFL